MKTSATAPASYVSFPSLPIPCETPLRKRSLFFNRQEKLITNVEHSDTTERMAQIGQQTIADRMLISSPEDLTPMEAEAETTFFNFSPEDSTQFYQNSPTAEKMAQVGQQTITDRMSNSSPSVLSQKSPPEDLFPTEAETFLFDFSPEDPKQIYQNSSSPTNTTKKSTVSNSEEMSLEKSFADKEEFTLDASSFRNFKKPENDEYWELELDAKEEAMELPMRNSKETSFEKLSSNKKELTLNTSPSSTCKNLKKDGDLERESTVKKEQESQNQKYFSAKLNLGTSLSPVLTPVDKKESSDQRISVQFVRRSKTALAEQHAEPITKAKIQPVSLTLVRQPRKLTEHHASPMLGKFPQKNPNEIFDFEL